MTDTIHKSYPKIPRYENQLFTVSEKIDGSNGLIYISADGGIVAGSRNNWLIDDGSNKWDNHGFGQWVKENEVDLQLLGSGMHYGEWYGKSINRNYGLKDRRFMLFNRQRYQVIPECCEIETVLLTDIDFPTLSLLVNHRMHLLITEGSIHVPGFPKPEGLIIRNQLTNHLMKYIID